MIRLPAAHVFEFWLLQYRRNWFGTAISGMLSPVIYLGALGLGVGGLISRDQIGDYLGFLAPGLLTFAAFQTAVGESTWPVAGANLWRRTYRLMVAAPMTAEDVFAGHAVWISCRIAAVSSVFWIVALAFGAWPVWPGLAALGAAVLTGAACVPAVMAFAIRQTGSAGFDILFRFVVMPLFLFSGVFFPADRLPDLLQPLAWLTPLWHGVELARAAGAGALAAGDWLHAGYLLILAAVGAIIAVRSYRQVLTT